MGGCSCGRNSRNSLGPPARAPRPLADSSNISSILEVNSELQARAASPVDDGRFGAWNCSLAESSVGPGSIPGFLEDLVVSRAVVDTDGDAAAAGIEACCGETGTGLSLGDRKAAGIPAASIVVGLLDDG